MYLKEIVYFSLIARFDCKKASKTFIFGRSIFGFL